MGPVGATARLAGGVVARIELWTGVGTGRHKGGPYETSAGRGDS